MRRREKPRRNRNHQRRATNSRIFVGENDDDPRDKTDFLGPGTEMAGRGFAA